MSDCAACGHALAFHQVGTGNGVPIGKAFCDDRHGHPCKCDGFVDANPANPKQAYGDKKAPVHLVPPALTLGASIALGEGAVKYGAYNWRSSRVESMTYVGAILRHLYAYLDGEDVDPESIAGKTHLQGIAACCAILLDSIEGGQLIDNRPPKGPAPRLVLTPKENPWTP